MVAIMENNQTEDGHIEIPGVLQKYMGDKKII
jgi:seryl-tRNA synthetase